jgi:hypothetical protein
MNRFFKAVDQDGAILDIVIADNVAKAEVAMMFRPWHHVFLSFKVVECSRQEWIDWKWA